MVIGRVRALSLRTDRHTPPRRVEHAVALAGQGLAGDIHANPSSPRQLLLADAAVYDRFDLPAHALRENLLVDVDTASLASGTILQIGKDVRIRLMFQCEACGQLDLQRHGLASALGNRRGMLARVLEGGTVCQGDLVRHLDDHLPAWSDDWRERVRKVLEAVPLGTVINYAELARTAGIQSSYCRAFPRLIENFGPALSARAAPARDAGDRQRWNPEGFFDLF